MAVERGKHALYDAADDPPPVGRISGRMAQCHLAASTVLEAVVAAGWELSRGVPLEVPSWLHDDEVEETA